MFTMTPKAHAVVRRVTAHSRISSSSGLRIAARSSAGDALGVGTVSGPRAGDEVIERDGARVFLAREAVPRVRDRVLDAVTERGGRVHFVVKRRR